MTIAVETDEGVLLVDVEAEDVVGVEPGASIEPGEVGVDLPLVVSAARSGATVVALVDRRPPLMVSYDAGATWREAGAGLPSGRAVAISEEHPDRMVFASESRLHVSLDGGRFWHALALELDGIRRVRWLDPGQDLD